MTRQGQERHDFILKIDELFSEYEKRGDFIINTLLVDNFNINKDTYFSVNSRFNCFYLNTYKNEVRYKSNDFDDLDQLYDELIIFKELILPKYI